MLTLEIYPAFEFLLFIHRQIPPLNLVLFLVMIGLNQFPLIETDEVKTREQAAEHGAETVKEIEP